MRISYGKLRVPLQRVAKRADGEYDVLACEVSIEVLGENFHAAYTEGGAALEEPRTRRFLAGGGHGAQGTHERGRARWG